MSDIRYDPFRAYTFGDFSFLFHKAFLRKLSVFGREILKGVYVAVRNSKWGTVTANVIREKVDQDLDSFKITTDLLFQHAGIEYVATIRILLEKEGTLQYDFLGTARSSFLKNRIGINVLIPTEPYQGKKFTVDTPGRERWEGVFPVATSPHQPAKGIAQFMVEGDPGITLIFSGEVFEMEDQRNWSDNSYKIYATPLELPMPVKVREGERHIQQVKAVLKVAEMPMKVPEPLVVLKKRGSLLKLPEIGLGSSTESAELSEEETEDLRSVQAGYLGYTCRLPDREWREGLGSAFRNSGRLGTGLLLSLVIPGNIGKAHVEEVTGLCKSHIKDLFTLELFDRDSEVSSGSRIDEFVRILRHTLPGVKIGGGSCGHFAELNRAKGLFDQPDHISYTVTPQVHAFDDLTMVENLKAMEYVARDVHNRFHRPVGIGAITLRQRPESAILNLMAAPGELPEGVDDRQPTVFAALWTMGSILALSRAGVSFATYYETTGQKGIMQGSRPLEGAGVFPEAPLSKYPLYYILRELLQKKAQAIVPLVSSNPEALEGFCFEDGETWIWNYCGKEMPYRFEDTENLENHENEEFDFSRGVWQRAPSFGLVGSRSLVRIRPQQGSRR